MDIAALVRSATQTAKSFGVAADVTFTLIEKTHSATTGTVGAPTVTSTVSGIAVRDTGDPKAYQRLGLTEQSPITLLFTPNTTGDEPPLGATFDWTDGATRTVASVEPIAPGSDAYAYTVIGA